MTDLAHRQTQLLARLAELDDRLHEIETELDSHQNRDWEELATEREGDEVLERLGVSGQTEMARIRAALKRIEDGEYGTCGTCGSEIAEARLDLLPYTAFCARCAR